MRERGSEGRRKGENERKSSDRQMSPLPFGRGAHVPVPPGRARPWFSSPLPIHPTNKIPLFTSRGEKKEEVEEREEGRGEERGGRGREGKGREKEKQAISQPATGRKIAITHIS